MIKNLSNFKFLQFALYLKMYAKIFYYIHIIFCRHESKTGSFKRQLFWARNITQTLISRLLRININ